MADFPLAFDVLWGHEVGSTGDGYVSAEEAARRHDRGGATKYGVSLRFLRQQGIDVDHDGDVDEQDVIALTADGAEDIYRWIFWDRPGYWRITSQFVATKTFDFAVNAGTRAATKLLQRSLNECGRNVEVDGVCGLQTVAATNVTDPDQLLRAMCRRQREFYLSIVAKRPDQRGNLDGWLLRAGWPGEVIACHGKREEVA